MPGTVHWKREIDSYWWHG